jgi:hypothetical protein
MKKLSIFTITLTVLIALNLGSANPTPYVFFRERCSCSSSDGSCEVSVTCAAGCTQFCGNGGNCYAYCSGYFAQLRSASPPQLQASKSSQLDTVSSDRSKPRLYLDVLETLSDHSTVSTSKQDIERLKRLRKALLSGEKFSLCVYNTPLDTFINDTASLTGLSLRTASDSTHAIVNVKLRDVTLDDILSKVSEQIGTTIIKEGYDHRAK